MSLPFYNPNIIELTDKYLRDHFTYIPEQVETLLTPEYMLKNLEINGRLSGDCDDISTLQAAIYKCMGFRVRFVAIRSDPENMNYDHVFTEIHNGSGWIIYDLTLPLGFQIDFHSRVAMEI